MFIAQNPIQEITHAFAETLALIWDSNQRATTTEALKTGAHSGAVIGWAAAGAQLLAGFEIAPGDRIFCFLRIFFGPLRERIAVPGLFKLERRQRQFLPARFRFFHEIAAR